MKQIVGFPGGANGKEPICQAGVMGDVGLIPRLGRCPEGGHGNPLQYFCLLNSMDRGAGELQSVGLQSVRHD